MRPLDARAHFVPWRASVGGTAIGISPTKEFGSLRVGDWRLLRIRREAIPERDREFNALGRRQIREVEEWMRHGGNLNSGKLERNARRG
jgi:hypothetical protein